MDEIFYKISLKFWSDQRLKRHYLRGKLSHFNGINVMSEFGFRSKVNQCKSFTILST